MEEDADGGPLSAHEVELSFIRALVPNPGFEFAFGFSLRSAVIRPLSASARVIRHTLPNGTRQYQHQAFGTYGGTGEPDWLPVQVPFPTPDAALNSALSGRDDAGSPVNPPVTHAVPELQLRCYKCREAFTLQRSHLLPTDAVACPSCGQASVATELNDINQ